MVDTFLFGGMPYILIMIAIVGSIWRYTSNKYTWSSQSSQFVENKTLFFGSFPWHYGIITIIVGHIVGLIIPQSFLWWNSVPVRLYILELSGLALAFLALFGLLALIYRRLTNTRVKSLTSLMGRTCTYSTSYSGCNGYWQRNSVQVGIKTGSQQRHHRGSTH